MRILFIGNSHTFFHDMPHMLRLMAASRGVEVWPVQNTSGFKGLEWHATQPDVRFNILFGGYDVIVLQHRAHPFPGVESLLAGAAQLMPYVERSGARAVAYMTWSELDNPQGQAAMCDAYEALCAEYPGMQLCPVGRVWQAVRREAPELPLYHTDGKHAGPLGAYLAAACFFRLITGQKAAGLPHHLDMGKPAFLGLDLSDGLKQDFSCPTVYDLDIDACIRICRTVDAVFEAEGL